MSPTTIQIILYFVAAAAIVRSVGILLLKIRQLRYLKRSVAAPKGWRDRCTEPEPPLLGVVALVLLAWTAPTTSSPVASAFAFALAGLSCAAAGWFLIVWAVVAFPDVSPGHYVLPEQRIVTAGPYGHVRNPLYVGAILIWLGLALAFQSGVTIAITLLYVLPGYLANIRSEETMLLEHFGEPYARYLENVGALLPRLGPWHGSTDG
jgi:protein-S-isoprenylcysteine O-methyltransferase Ste14